MKQTVIGIDLGTTYSLGAFVKDGKVEIIANEQFSTFLPSLVTITENGPLVGWEAEKCKEKYPTQTFYSFKRFMGRDLDAKLREGIKKLPYLVSSGPKGQVLLGEPPHQYNPEMLSALVLQKIKNLSEKILGCKVNQAIITVPAYFDDAQRQATKNAAFLAGIEPLRILNEPTAAAISYGLENKENSHILVYDLGGGTFDISILKIQASIFRVLTTYGDTQLGGDDFDQALIDFLLQKYSLDLDLKIPELLQTLKTFAEKLKIELSNSLEAEFSLQTKTGERKIQMTRAELDAVLFPWVEKTKNAMKIALQSISFQPKDIDVVVLVGGSSRIPLVRKMVQDFFQKPPYLRLDPDKVVAYGAAIQADLLQNARRSYLLMDILPLSLGIETLGGVFAKLILKNASLPAKVKETFSTSVDNQTAVEINIYQGEREFVKDCRKLGKFRLHNLPKMPAGLPRIEVDFTVDPNGILQVSAEELRSKVKAQIDVIPEHGLSRSEVEKMIEDSILHAQEDIEHRQEIEGMEKAKSLLLGLKKGEKEWENLLSKEKKEILLLKIRTLEEKLGQRPAPQLEIKNLTEELGDLTRDLADQIYSKAVKEKLMP